MAIKLVVFDIAGTTLKDDNVVAIAFRDAFLKNGYTIALQDAHPYMGVKKIIAVRLMLERLNVDFNDADVLKIHEAFVNSMVAYYKDDPSVYAMDGAENTFQKLQTMGVKIALNTGFPRVIADSIVQRLQWLEKGLIDTYIASDEVELGRPSSQMIHRLMETTGVSNPLHIMKVGDTVVDVEEGKNAGCKYVVAVLTGSGTVEELESAEPTHIVSNLSEILEILENDDN